jgi:hypothetical protein
MNGSAFSREIVFAGFLPISGAPQARTSSWLGVRDRFNLFVKLLRELIRLIERNTCSEIKPDDPILQNLQLAIGWL